MKYQKGPGQRTGDSLGQRLEVGADGVAVVVETVGDDEVVLDELEARRARLRALDGGALAGLANRAPKLSRGMEVATLGQVDEARIANIHDEVRGAIGGN